MVVRFVKRDEILEVMKLSSICFNYPYVNEFESEEEYIETIISNPQTKSQKYWNEQLVAVDENDNLMASIVSVPLSFRFDGYNCLGNGIGNVTTHPQYRKRGAVRAIFNQMLQDAYKKGELFSYLYPFSEEFYGKFGYVRVENSHAYHLNISSFPSFMEEGKIELLTVDNTPLLEEVKDVYREYAKRFNLMTDRKEDEWGNILDAKASINNKYVYLFRDTSGKAKAYIVFEPKGRVLKSRELVFLDPPSLQSILNFIKSYNYDFDYLDIHLPSVIPLGLLLKNFHTANSIKKCAPNGMVRVINVKEVLQRAQYLQSGKVNIRVTDTFIENNNTMFTVEFDKGRAKTISCNDSVSSTEEMDIEMSISAFSSCIVGIYTLSDMYYMNDVKIIKNEQVLEQVFYKKPSFINDYF